jgi:histidinol phosphatase-like enzyme
MESTNKLRPAVFLDRDGVISKWEKGDTGTDADWYILDWSQFEYLPRVIDALMELYQMPYEVFVLSNQSGISKELTFDERPVTHHTIYQLFDRMHVDITERIRSRLLCNAGVPGESQLTLPEHRNVQNMISQENRHVCNMVIRDFMFCPHLPEHNCACRKPKPGMIYSLATKWEIDLSRSWMIGDQNSDVMAGYNAGIMRLVKIDPEAPEYSGIGYDGDTPHIARSPFPESTFISATRDLFDAVRYIRDKDEFDHPTGTKNCQMREMYPREE